MNIAIRLASETDFEVYSRLYNQINDYHAAARPETFRHVEGAPRSFEDYQALLADPLQQVLLAVVEGQVVGYVHALLRERAPIPIMVPARYAVVDTLVVDEAFRRRGVGQALMAAAEDWACQNGAEYTELNVWVFNQPAVRLYEELGYEVISQRMRKNLTPT
jgi:ribosomal protein S18 acetylase RimI-like enzyme